MSTSDRPVVSASAVVGGMKRHVVWVALAKEEEILVNPLPHGFFVEYVSLFVVAAATQIHCSVTPFEVAAWCDQPKLLFVARTDVYHELQPGKAAWMDRGSASTALILVYS